MKEAEPTISKVIQEVAKATETKLAGYEYRVKDIDSYKRKMNDKFNEGNLEYKAKDIVRYTYLAYNDNLVDKIKEIRKILETKGYKTVEVKNYWIDKTNPYNGVNTVVKISSGEEIEIQYHTFESFEVKEKLHKFYETQRELNKFSEEFILLEDKMFKIAENLSMPNGINNLKR